MTCFEAKYSLYSYEKEKYNFSLGNVYTRAVPNK